MVTKVKGHGDLVGKLQASDTSLIIIWPDVKCFNNLSNSVEGISFRAKTKNRFIIAVFNLTVMRGASWSFVPFLKHHHSYLKERFKFGTLF